MSSVGILAAVGAILIGLPYLVWRYFGLRHIAPLAVVQIICGLSLGPSILGRLSPELQQLSVRANDHGKPLGRVRNRRRAVQLCQRNASRRQDVRARQPGRLRNRNQQLRRADVAGDGFRILACVARPEPDRSQRDDVVVRDGLRHLHRGDGTSRARGTSEGNEDRRDRPRSAGLGVCRHDRRRSVDRGLRAPDRCRRLASGGDLAPCTRPRLSSCDRRHPALADAPYAAG